MENPIRQFLYDKANAQLMENTYPVVFAGDDGRIQDAIIEDAYECLNDNGVTLNCFLVKPSGRKLLMTKECMTEREMLIPWDQLHCNTEVEEVSEIVNAQMQSI